VGPIQIAPLVFSTSMVVGVFSSQVSTYALKGITALDARLLDGGSIQSSHTCDLDLLQLPDAVIKSHAIPGLATSSLLSVGQLVDSNCSVIFDKVEVKFLHNNSEVLQGQKKFKKALWTVDMQPKSKRTKSNQDFSKFKIQNQVSKSKTM
jgi:hypothetical protein